MPQNFMPQNYMPQNYMPQNFMPQNFMPQNFMPQNFMPQNFMPRGFRRNRRRENALKAKLMKKEVGVETVVPGQVVTKTWEVQNSGAVAWPTGTIVRHCRGSVGLEKTPQVAAAEPGAVVEITAEIRVPSVPGAHRLAFRLSDITGRKFGPKLRCDVTVQLPAPAAAPPTLAPSVPQTTQLASPQAQATQPSAPTQPTPVLPTQTTAPAVAASAPSQYAVQLEMLKAMGWNNPELNEYLLEQNKGNVDRVVQWWLEQTKQ